MSIERYLIFTKFMMETVFSHMYVNPNLQRYRRTMSGRAGNRDGGRYFQKMVNFWLSAFIYCIYCVYIYIYIYIYIVIVPLRKHTHATSGTRAAGWIPLH